MSTSDPSRAAIEQRFDELFSLVLRLGDADLRLIRAEWDAGDPAERGSAWNKVRDTVKKQHREDLMADARDTIARWADSLSAAQFEFGPFMTKPSGGMESPNVRREAIPPVMDAIASVVAADGLDPSEREMLSGPVGSITSRQQKT